MAGAKLELSSVSVFTVCSIYDWIDLMLLSAHYGQASGDVVIGKTAA